MEATYSDALRFTLSWEGGYSNHKDDPGGATMKGITQATYDSYRKRKGLPTQSVKYITDVEVGDVYKNSYWQACGADMLPTPLDACVFDTAVNCGVSRAVKMLQKTLGLTDDGVIGPKTKAAIEGIVDVKKTCLMYIAKRNAYYDSLVATRSSFKVFLKGWKNRTEALTVFVEKRA